MNDDHVLDAEQVLTYGNRTQRVDCAAAGDDHGEYAPGGRDPIARLIGVFPERVSAFSPEDLYSNVLGIRVASALLRVGGAETRPQYDANMDAVLPQVLEWLGAVSAECSRRAVQLVDRIW